jgi:hypothetical protein
MGSAGAGPQPPASEYAASRGNVLGRMTALTLMTPVRRQWLWFLRLGFRLAPYSPLRDHIIQFNFIKYVRWVLVDGLDGEDLRYPYLHFESNFDGPWEHYIDAFAYVIATDIRLTWGRGPDFPHPPPAEPLKDWIAANSMDGGTYYCAHAEHSTRDLQNALAVRDAFLDFRARAASLGPDEFKAAWQQFLTDEQSRL